MSERMATQAHYAVETQALCRTYHVGDREIPALRGVDLKVETGIFAVVEGRSGSGKTTLLNCLGGLDQPTSGSVRIMGEELGRMDDKRLTQWRGRRIGFIFQSFGLLPTLSAFENVELAQRIIGVDPKQSRRRAMYCLDLVGLKKWARHRPYEMSGGQQQRVAIARSLANSPALILADEPTGELDTATTQDILRLFRRIVEEENVTLLMSSHNVLVEDYVDRVLKLKDGQLLDA